MKKKIIIFVGIIMLLASVMTLAACSQWEAPYSQLAKEGGYSVKVCFDSNGGMMGGSPTGIKVVDVYSTESGIDVGNGQKAVSVLSPDDERRENRAMEVSNDGYFLAGWYQERTPRVDENGNALDAWGELTSVSGREQGYIYGGKWDFSKDKLTVDPNKTYGDNEYALTLYAAWIPYFEFEVYEKSDDGFVKLDELTVTTLSYESPEWEGEKAVQISMNSMPQRRGYTLVGAYTDSEMKTEMKGTFDYKTQIDYEKGIAYQSTIQIYTLWEEGNRYNIYTAKQFMDNAEVNGIYEIHADLDFSEISYWPPVLSKGTFQGKIIGNGHKFSNITATQADADNSIYCGLFGRLAEKAELTDVSFENVSFTIRGSRKPGFNYGLLAGAIDDAAKLEGVSISGNLIVSSEWNISSECEIGLLCATGSAHGIDISGIVCKNEGDTEKFVITVTDDGKVEVSASTAQ